MMREETEASYETAAATATATTMKEETEATTREEREESREGAEREEVWEGEEEEEDEFSLSSESEIGEALDFLDSRDDAEGGILDGSFTPQHTRRPNAHGGLHSRPNNSTLQPISNKSQKLTNRIRASPLEVFFVSVGKFCEFSRE